MVHAYGGHDGRPCQRADHGPARAALRVTTSNTSLQATERDTERVQHAREDSQALRQALALQRCTCVDASGGPRAMTRRVGRAPRGARGLGAVPQTEGAPLPMLAARGLHGLEAVMTSAGATDTAVVQASTAQGLGPTLRSGDSVGLAHWRAHQMTTLQELMEPRGAWRLYVPPDSPDRAPIEQAWSKLKTCLRTAKARTRQALERAIQHALTTMTAADAHGWFTYGGYPVPELANRSRAP